ncbi:MAG: alpha/beta hydrolase-fold protein [Actinomycetes bacterium]
MTNENVTRRAVLLGGAGLAAAAAAGVWGWPQVPNRLKQRVGLGADPYVPDAEEGTVTLEVVASAERGTDVSLFTAVPAGYGDGAGLPVVVILHGASARPPDYQAFGFGRFLTAAVESGAAPFALAGADGGLLQWEPQPGGDNPRGMVMHELPQWLSDRGFDASRRAVWGWSMGGYGALRLAEVAPDWARATAAFSPAVTVGDPVFAAADRLDSSRLGVWCGLDDPFYGAVTSLVDGLPQDPAVTSFTPGAHTRVFWNDQTLTAFGFLAKALQ